MNQNLGKLIGDIVDKNNRVKFISLFYLFKKYLPQVDYEWGAMYINDFIISFGEKNKKHIKIPKDLEEYCIENSVLILIHNHPIKTSPFASPEDFNIYAKLGVEYGVITNELGTFIV